MWPSKPEVLTWLHLRQYDRYHYNSDGKHGVFDEGKLAECVSDYNTERQPEIAIWPPKPETTGTKQIASKFQQQVRHFRPWRARIKCRQVIASLVVIENPEFGVRWNFDVICQSSRDVIISGFGNHIDISDCRSLLYSLANTICHLYMILNLRFVEILTVPQIVSLFQRYKYLRFRPPFPFPIVDHYGNHLGTPRLYFLWWKAVGSPLEFWWYMCRLNENGGRTRCKPHAHRARVTQDISSTPHNHPFIFDWRLL